MSSPTKKTKTRRVMRKANMGKERKRIARNKGTTPPFAIHKDTATPAAN